MNCCKKSSDTVFDSAFFLTNYFEVVFLFLNGGTKQKESVLVPCVNIFLRPMKYAMQAKAYQCNCNTKQVVVLILR